MRKYLVVSLLVLTTFTAFAGASVFFPDRTGIENTPFTKVLVVEGITSINFLEAARGNGGRGPWTANGNIAYSSDILLWGQNTIGSDGDADYLSAPNHPDFNLSDKDFTIHTWRYMNNINSLDIIGANWESTTKREWVFYSDATNYCFIISPDGAVATNSFTMNVTPVTGNMVHLAIVRKGDEIRGFIDGIKQGGIVLTPGFSAFDADTDLTWCAHNDAGGSMDGYLFQPTMVVGKALWWQDFTSPPKSY